MRSSLSWILSGMVAVGAISTASAASVAFLGVDADRGEAWRSSDVGKPLVYDGRRYDKAYGSDGYVCVFRATADSGPTTVFQSLPSYVSSVAVDPDILSWASPSYQALDDPREAIGPAVANMPATGLWYSWFGASYHTYLTVTLASSTNFVLAVIVDTHGDSSTYGATGIRVSGPGGVTDQQTLTPNGQVDYLFFEIGGNAGDAFQVALAGGAAGPGVSGLGFERPRPETTATTYVGLDLDRGAVWRSSNVDKPNAFDPNNDQAYGSDGYRCIAGPGWGTVIESLPSYIASVTSPQSQWSGYAALDDPTLGIGADVADLASSGLWYGPSVATSKYFTFTLAQPADFLLTVILDTHGSPAGYPTSAVKVEGYGCVAELTGLTMNGTPDYAFFRVRAEAGDEFSVWLSSASDSQTTAGLGFEAIQPDPPRGTQVILR